MWLHRTSANVYMLIWKFWTSHNIFEKITHSNVGHCEQFQIDQILRIFDSCFLLKVFFSWRDVLSFWSTFFEFSTFFRTCLLVYYVLSNYTVVVFAVSIKYVYAYCDSMTCKAMRSRGCLEYYGCSEIPRSILWSSRELAYAWKIKFAPY